MTFADRLKRLRKKKGISVYRLAKELQIAYSAARSWEAGKTKPSDDNLKKLCDYFGCDPAWLMYGKEDKISREVMEVARMIERYIKRHPGEQERIMGVIERLVK